MTTKKDLKKGVSRIPLEMARIKSEDLHNNSVKASLQMASDDFDFTMD
jgi:hypothetical protein